MKIRDIKVGTTYIGLVDHIRGLGSHRTVIEHDEKFGFVTVRNEQGENPPDCYVALANMGADEFAAWALRPVAQPMQRSLEDLVWRPDQAAASIQAEDLYVDGCHVASVIGNGKKSFTAMCKLPGAPAHLGQFDDVDAGKAGAETAVRAWFARDMASGSKPQGA